jgi:hypothetical protein
MLQQVFPMPHTASSGFRFGDTMILAGGSGDMGTKLYKVSKSINMLTPHSLDPFIIISV